jgi:hypothetical protein
MTCRAAFTAGAKLKPTPITVAVNTMKPYSRHEAVSCKFTRTSLGTNASNPARIQNAMKIPARAPINESTSPSVSHCRNKRSLPAPSARRTAIS